VVIPAASETRFVPNEVLVELRSDAPRNAAQTLARTQRLTLLSSDSFRLAGVSLHRYRITDGRSVRTVLQALARNGRIARAQPNYVFELVSDAVTGVPDLPLPDMPGLSEDLLASVPPAVASEAPKPATAQEAPASTPDRVAAAPAPELQSSTTTPADQSMRDLQYALGKLRLGDAHRVARGERVRVAVIDSGVDERHPELAGVVSRALDAVGGDVQPHTHGTAMVGAIAARARLTGAAPSADIVSIRAFTGQGGRSGAEGTTVHLLRSLDLAEAEGARIVNMSFAGPRDALLARALGAARERGIILIAASGNAGPRAAPMFPAADPNVIAVTATDANDGLFDGAVRGAHVAVAAPGVDVIVPAPGGRYELTTGTSVAAAQVSGVVALMLQRDQSLDPDGVRRVLVSTARDLGQRGRDPMFGAGLVDAYGAVQAITAR
jgi:subtilisin family serine protease